MSPLPTDTFLTLAAPAEGYYYESRSKFLAFAMPASTPDEAGELCRTVRNRYADARHVCFAYKIGTDHPTTRANDDGEPSGTAGRPILGQIRSHGLTNVIVIVVRYFGGIKLGVSGLTQAYKAAAAAALDSARVVEKTIDEEVQIRFPYAAYPEVMRLIKTHEPRIASQTFHDTCRMSLVIRRSALAALTEALARIEGMKMPPAGNDDPDSQTEHAS